MTRRTSALATLLLAAFALAAVSLWPARAADPAAADKGGLAAGDKVTVFLRGDAVGQATNYVGSARNTPSVSGAIASVSDQWVVLDTDKTRVYIPRPGVLLIEVARK
ncbi:MAG TPA: hypothetical protein VEA69_19500 [Tepidisphaeraceae bacterium]|nr:hypothetical protein [Tepidisphaeraceae bacterium]